MSDLYLFDQEFDPAVEGQKAVGIAGTSAKPQPIQDWKGLAAAIRKQASIRQLTLSFHGSPGGMTVGDEGLSLDDPNVKALFTAGGAKPPRIETIRFLGCNMGESPAGMAAFGAIFGASKMIGYTWFLVTQPFQFNFPQGTDAATIDKSVAPFLPYLVGPPPSGRVIAATYTKFRAFRLDLVAFYGAREYGFASAMPIPEREARTKKPWTKAEALGITERDIAKTEKEFAAAPVVPFQLVTLTLSQASTAPAKSAAPPPRAAVSPQR